MTMIKKFSNITGQKVNEEPKEAKSLNEEEQFKSKLFDLVENILSIRTYGPVDKYQRYGLIKIAGKEMLIEAIIDLFSEKSINDKTKVLEGLKSDIRDWNVIDAKIESLKEERILLSNRNKFKVLTESYVGESLLVKVEKDINKITKEKTLKDYITLTKESKLESDVKNKLIEIYSVRLNKLT